MIWLSNVGWYDTSVVYVLQEDTTYVRYDDIFDAGLDTQTVEASPAEGLFVPIDALGKVWIDQPGVRESLGFATEPELTMETQMQMLERGEMVYIPSLASVIAFKRGLPNTWSSYEVVIQP